MGISSHPCATRNCAEWLVVWRLPLRLKLPTKYKFDNRPRFLKTDLFLPEPKIMVGVNGRVSASGPLELRMLLELVFALSFEAYRDI